MTREFTVLPAIDLRDGRVVRLEQGDFDRETAFSDDPVAVAQRFAEAGVTWLHVVDLDGARGGTPVHGELIAAIVAAVGDRISVEVAGGLRDADAVRRTLAAGAARVVVGTAALQRAAFAGELVATHGPERVAVAVDVRGGRAVGQGWATDQAGYDLDGTLRALAQAGVTTYEVTAIDQDGLLQGPDLALCQRVLDLGVGDVIASAGIATVADLRAVRALGCGGAIVGRALYDGRLALADALTA
jgi:phosphoribosylformimino-5-aminoimidazole carboxamide ribotide isomerase